MKKIIILITLLVASSFVKAQDSINDSTFREFQKVLKIWGYCIDGSFEHLETICVVTTPDGHRVLFHSYPGIRVASYTAGDKGREEITSYFEKWDPDLNLLGLPRHSVQIAGKENFEHIEQFSISFSRNGRVEIYGVHEKDGKEEKFKQSTID